MDAGYVAFVNALHYQQRHETSRVLYGLTPHRNLALQGCLWYPWNACSSFFTSHEEVYGSHHALSPGRERGS
jgi:hypothetical protein